MNLYIQPTPPEDTLDIPALVNQLMNRVISAERMIEQKVSANSLAKILLTDDDIVLMGDRITLIGDVNLFGWIRDISGNPTTVDPSSVTRVVGGVIQTGAIQSINWAANAGSQLDLDAGTIKLGGSSAPKFSVTAAGVMSCVDALVSGTLQANSVITNSCTVDGVSMATISSNASSALSGLSGKLDNAAATVIASGFYLKTTNYDAGTGIAIYNGGIIGKSGGVNKFVLGNDGTATFAGALSAATGTFAGNVSTAGWFSATGGTDWTDPWTSDTYKVTVKADTAELNSISVLGISSATGGVGVFGRGSATGNVTSFGGYFQIAQTNVNVSSAAVYASAVDTDTWAGWFAGKLKVTGATVLAGLECGALVSTAASTFQKQLTLSVGTGTAPMVVSSTTKVSNLNVDMLDGYSEADFFRSLGSTASGSTTYTLTGAPSGKTLSWINATVGGQAGIIPVWV